MDQRRSLEITAPTAVPAVSPPPRMRPSQTMGGRRTAMRIMNRASVGVVAVYEQDPVATSSGARVLVFEYAKGVTRVAQFPENWQRLTDEELTAIRRAAS